MIPRNLAQRGLALLAVGGLALTLAACGSDDDGGSSATTTAAASGEVTVKDPWARTSAMGQDAGAAYMVIENGSDKAVALVSASAPADIAGKVELHETVMKDGATETTMAGATTTAMGGATTTGMDGGGMGEMTMRQVEKIEVPAKGSVALEPGGYHVMLLELPKPLEAGTSFDLTLTFDDGATKTVTVEVRDSQ